MTQPNLDPVFQAAAQRFGVDPDLLRAQAHVESGFDSGAVSPKGAVGLMQILPSTAKALGVDPTDPAQSILGAAALMRQNLDRYQGNLEAAVAAYHGGTDPANWGPKTQGYVTKVANTFQAIKGNAGMLPMDKPSAPAPGDDPVIAALTAGAPASGPQGARQPAQGVDPVIAALTGQPTTTAQPQNSASPTPYDPTADMSTWQKVMAGAGKAVVDIGRGGGQLLRHGIEAIAPPEKGVSDLVTGGAGHSFADTLGLPTQADIDYAKQLDAPLMRTGAGTAGYIGGNLATTLLPLGLAAKGAQAANMTRSAALAQQLMNPGTYKAAAAGGALLANLQPVASDESRVENTLWGAAGGAGGKALAAGLGRVATPVQNALTPVAQKAVDTLRGAGVPLDLAQTTGSPFWNRVRSSLSDNVFTAGGQQEMRDAQQQAYNAAVLKTMGADAPAATSDVMGDARRQLNAKIGDVLSRNQVQIDMPALNQLAATQAAAAESEKGPAVKIINRIVDSMDGQGNIDGQVAYGIKKDLDRMGSSADSDLAHFARQTRSTLMDSMNASLSGADQQTFSQARGQMANMFNIERAVDKTGTGNISPQRLAAALNTARNRSFSVYGNGPQDLVNLAQAGAQVLPDKLPNSGTTARMFMQALPGLVTGAGTYAATGDPLEAAKYAGGVVALPKLAQMLLNNPASVRRLSQGVGSPAVQAMLQKATKNQALGAALMRAPAAGLTAPLPAPQQ
ncbi:lytic transglycosylase domain-containing protein [Roseateles saccharophilus]|uniref:Transglycosylase-like protein with SLT domain n=2 Tax=Roseateles saccharophilus TaxID=304 RepID=A0A4V2VPM4_ROSSA|nr:lytic transglycosylase domain-containing protein [Roseateles saccharophilus]TCU91289.1 transglycosylase-like protein with SLT domain [Roseateles saccharophilus]